MASPFAFVTLVSSDSYLPGALAQVAALRELHPNLPTPPEVDFATVCIVTPESLDVATIKRLRKEFDLVIAVEILEQENQYGLQLLGRPDLTTVLTKLHIFRLTQFQKIIFLDADVLPIRPLSHLFNLPHEFSAAPDVGWPDIFNSGVLVVTPGDDKFNELYDLIKTKPSWDGGDQGILNEWRGENWNRLSFTYNTTPTAAYTYAPAYERYGSQISALHFIGSNKPWNALPYRPPFAGQQPEPSDSSRRAYDYQSLVDRWFDVYDRHYRTQGPKDQAGFQVKPYPSAWDQPSQSPHSPKLLGLEELKRLAIGGLNSSGETHPGEGLYQSLPLEGRIDLMRPRKPVVDEVQVENVQQSPLPPVQILSDDWDGFPSESFSYDEALSTPLARQLQLDEYGRWRTLHTPAPHVIPGGPRLGMVPLPSTPTPFGSTSADFYASESESEGLLLARPPSAAAHCQHRGDNSFHVSQPHHHPAHDPEEIRDKQHHNTLHGSQQACGAKPPSSPCQLALRPDYQNSSPQLHAPQRPMSPPLLSWNPAQEPPPSNAPPGAFPSNTYFSNVWDQTPSRDNDQPPGLSPPDLSRLFRPPPTPDIPASLIKEGHYRNVTGDNQDITPSPDRTKVKSIFPWEENLRPLPGRIFPDSDAPPPSLFLSPGSQSQTSTTTPSTPEMRRPTGPSRTLALSPLHIFSSSLSFANTWDTVPSIQKYATRLMKPPPPPPLAPAFEDDIYRKGRRKSRDDRSEVDSQDGDDEDNADDEDEDEPAAPSTTKWDAGDESDREEARRRSRRGSVVCNTLKPVGSAAVSATKKTRRYRDQGVQTITVEKRSQGIQVDPRKPDKHQKRAPTVSKRYWPSATTTDAPMVDLSPGNVVAPQSWNKKKSPTSSPPSHSPGVKPVREFISPPPFRAAEDKVKPLSPPLMKPSVRSTSSSTLTGIAPQPPQLPMAPSGPIRSRASSLRSSTSSIVRQTSNDSSLGSPASSYGPLSPLDVQSILPPVRKSGRVWDPARGVELFKKGSEEVLARFLRMGSFDEETR